MRAGRPLDSAIALNKGKGKLSPALPESYFQYPAPLDVIESAEKGVGSMVDFIRKRLQVFVSSTFSDLIEERQAAVEAILTAGHIPAGMELFTSGDETQMDVIKQWIDESDIYLLILGGRYGCVDPKAGRSYTHLEYEYAISQDKPLFSCVIKEAALEIKVKTQGTAVIEMENPANLKRFRELVLSKMVRFWEDSKDIKITVGETLSHFTRRPELVGWVRATEQANMPALADEIARLSKENALLRGQIQNGKAEILIHGLTFGELKSILLRKGLLDFVIAKRLDLLKGITVYDYEEEIPELSIVGLIAYDKSFNKFTLTDAGRVFMNQVELEQLGQPKSEEVAGYVA